MFGRLTQSITFYDNVTPVAIASSTDASPIVITTTGAHGLVTGQRVIVFGHATNIAANGIYKAVVLSGTTFSMTNEYSGTPVIGSGTGAGSGGAVCKAPEIAACIQDMENIDFQLDTVGVATLTLKAVMSAGKNLSSQTGTRGDLPNFGATITDANPYTFVQIQNLDTYAAINGSDGISLAGIAVSAAYEANTNVAKYFTVIPTAWTSGTFSIRGTLTSD